jgi:hypothetical protein
MLRAAIHDHSTSTTVDEISASKRRIMSTNTSFGYACYGG